MSARRVGRSWGATAPDATKLRDPPQGRRKPGPRAPGFTLLEMTVSIAVMVVLGALAVPSYASLLARQRLEAVARNLQADIGLARQEAGRRGQTVYLVFEPGAQWCYAMSTAVAASCRQASPGTVIKQVRADDHPGITLLQASTMALDGNTGASLATIAGLAAAASQGLHPGGHARFASRDGPQLQVQLGVMGRAGLCAPGQPVAHTSPCPADAPPT